MDQVKVGKYISQKRKELGLTQKELSELIGVTDKAVSKWERDGKEPDEGEEEKVVTVAISQAFGNFDFVVKAFKFAG